MYYVKFATRQQQVIKECQMSFIPRIYDNIMIGEDKPIYIVDRIMYSPDEISSSSIIVIVNQAI